MLSPAPFKDGIWWLNLLALTGEFIPEFSLALPFGVPAYRLALFWPRLVGDASYRPISESFTAWAALRD